MMAADFTAEWGHAQGPADDGLRHGLLRAAGRANQYSYVTAQQAAQAMQVMVRNQVVRASCAPCADHASYGTTWWQAHLDGVPADPASLSVANGAGWKHLSRQLGLPASELPRRSGPAQTGH
jgi:hypothetical protein